jgi:hypothetical protein
MGTRPPWLDRQPWITVVVMGSPSTRLRGDFEKNGVFIGWVRERRPLPRPLQVPHRGHERRGKVRLLVVATAQLAAFFESDPWGDGPGSCPTCGLASAPDRDRWARRQRLGSGGARYDGYATLGASSETGHAFETVLRRRSGAGCE